MSTPEQTPKQDNEEQHSRYIFSRTRAERVGFFGGVLGLILSVAAEAEDKLSHTAASINIGDLALSSASLMILSLSCAMYRSNGLGRRFNRLQESNNPNIRIGVGRISRLTQKAIGFLAAGAVLISSAYIDAPKLPTEAGKAQGFIPGNKFLESATVSTPYFIDANGSIDILDECAFKPAPSDKVDEIDKNMFVSPSAPLSYKLPSGPGRVAAIEMQQLDEYSNGNDVFWTSGFTVQVLPGNNVKISEPINGGDLPAQLYNGPDSPSTTTNIPDNYYYSGNFSLLDYAIVNNKGTFYLNASCDMQETNKLLAQFNAD